MKQASQAVCVAIAGAALGSTLASPAQADARLPVAAMERDLASVTRLLAELDTDVDALGPYATPALHWIVRIEELDLARRLLEAGADPDLRNGLGLSSARLGDRER